MTTEQTVNAQIDLEFKKFNEATFDLEPLPKDLLERYKKAIFVAAPNAHRIASDTIKAQIGKKLKDLTNYEVGFILNVISATPLNILYKDLDEALVKNREIEQIKLGYNLMVKEINEQMEQKRINMLTLSNPDKAPLKLVTAQA